MLIIGSQVLQLKRGTSRKHNGSNRSNIMSQQHNWVDEIVSSIIFNKVPIVNLWLISYIAVNSVNQTIDGAAMHALNNHKFNGTNDRHKTFQKINLSTQTVARNIFNKVPISNFWLIQYIAVNSVNQTIDGAAMRARNNHKFNGTNDRHKTFQKIDLSTQTVARNIFNKVPISKLWSRPELSINPANQTTRGVTLHIESTPRPNRRLFPFLLKFRPPIFDDDDNNNNKKYTKRRKSEQEKEDSKKLEGETEIYIFTNIYMSLYKRNE